MRALLLIPLLAVAGCSKTSSPARDEPEPRPTLVERCDDDRDNDGDDAVDCSDPDCDADEACPRCGDTVRTGGEICDGRDLGGATCQSEGFAAGALSCTSACELETRGCFDLPEDCATEGDEDGNGDADCADATCAARPECLTAALEPGPTSDVITARLELAVKVTDGRGDPADVKLYVYPDPGMEVAAREVNTEGGVARLQVRLGSQARVYRVVFTASTLEVLAVDLTATEPPFGTVHAVLNLERQPGVDTSGRALFASVGEPVDLARAADGSLYVAERCRVLRVSPSGELSVVLGTGTCRDAGLVLDPGEGTSVGGIALDEARGRLVFSDPEAGYVRALTLASGQVENLAGGGFRAGDEADGQPGREVTVPDPAEITLGPDGTVYVHDATLGFVSIDTDGFFHLLALGLRDCADHLSVNAPEGDGARMFFDAEGRWFVSSSMCGLELTSPAPAIARLVEGTSLAPANLVREAGGGEDPLLDGAGARAASLPLLRSPAFDDRGNLLALAGHAIVRVNSVSHVVEVVAGSVEQGGFAGDPGSADVRFDRPASLLVVPGGDGWIADTGNRTVRRIVGLGKGPADEVLLEPFDVATPFPGQLVTTKVKVSRLGEPVAALPVELRSEDPAITVGAGEAGETADVTVFPFRAGLGLGSIPLRALVHDLHGEPYPAVSFEAEVIEPDAGMAVLAMNPDDTSPLEKPAGTFAITGTVLVPTRFALGGGEVFIDDSCRLYRGDSTGVAQLLAGTGVCGDSPDAGAALESAISSSSLVSIPSRGRVYFAQATVPRRLRYVDLGTGRIEAGPAYTQNGTWVLSRDGDDLLVAGSQGVDRLDLDTGATVRVYDFTFGPSKFTGGTRAYVDPAGDVVLAGTYRRADNSTTNRVERLTGSDPRVLLEPPLDGGSTEDGVASDEVRLDALLGITFDGAGNLVYADGARVRRIVGGVVETLAGSLESESRELYVPAGELQLAPQFPVFDGEGHLWLRDGNRLIVVW